MLRRRLRLRLIRRLAPANVQTFRVLCDGDLARVAEAVCRGLAPGDVVALQGPMGAGKTTLVGACAAHLGVREPVTSPTFALVHRYAAPVPVVHADLYRLLDQPERDVDDILLALDEDALSFVEWPEHGAGWLPAPRRTVTIAVVSDGARAFDVRDAPTT